MRTFALASAFAGAFALIVPGAAAPAQQAATGRVPHAVVQTGDAPGDTLRRIVPLPEMVVSTTRLGDRAPLARSVLGRDELLRRNTGQDTPMLLATLPGAYAYSDAGNGIGYSYLSVRGFPQRRISVLVNGVPLNDPESHEVYWIDHPDLMASTSEVQLQRGVGSALYGGASLGGTVAVETAPFGETPRASATVAYGSWETRRTMLETDSGRLPGGWNFYGRYSRIETQGYREQSWSKLWSYAFAARRTLGSQSFRLNLYGGPEETHLAYLGVPRAYLEGRVSGDADRDRRFNPITYAGECDHFFEPHYEFIHTWAPRAGLTVSQTLFWFEGRGYYDEQRSGRSLADFRLTPWGTEDSLLVPPTYYSRTRWEHRSPTDSFRVAERDSATGRFQVTRFDLVRRRTVANRHFGWIPRVRVEHSGGVLTVGGELRAHDGRHWGEVVTGDGLPPGTAPGHTYYDYHPRTLSASLFVREEWQPVPQLLLTADLAWRHQSYRMREDRFDGIRFDQDYDFLLPRLGMTFTPCPSTTLFTSFAVSSREPAFRDLYDAEGAGSVPLYRIRDTAANRYEDPLIRPEHVSDWEAGFAWRGARAAATVNLFRMDLRDELVYAGQFNTDLGYPILGNAGRSVHQGVELAARTRRALPGGLRLDVDANATLSDNHFVEYREAWGPDPGDVVSYDGKTLGLFPAVLGNLAARVGWRAITAGFEAQHAGRMYLDNNQDLLASIDPRTVLNATAGWGFAVGEASRAEFSLRVSNLLDARYAAGGYMDYDAEGSLAPMFVPAATRSWLTQVSAGF
jgi:iron complex outermembrane receptor protein